jgi:hypothetical protein
MFMLCAIGCNSTVGPESGKRLDSADTSLNTDDPFALVDGLPDDCPNAPYVRLPLDDQGKARRQYSESEVIRAVYGDANHHGPFIYRLFPVVHAGGRWVASGWWVYENQQDHGGGIYKIRYGDNDGSQEPYVVACD